MEVTLYL